MEKVSWQTVMTMGVSIFCPEDKFKIGAVHYVGPQSGHIIVADKLGSHLPAQWHIVRPHFVT